MRYPYASTAHDQILQVNVYPYGQEANSGPIQSLIVPVAPVSPTAVGTTATGASAGSITVNGITTSPWTTGTSAALIAAALNAPGSGNQIVMPFVQTPNTSFNLRFVDQRRCQRLRLDLRRSVDPRLQ